jgi:hypothetical protein
MSLARARSSFLALSTVSMVSLLAAIGCSSAADAPPAKGTPGTDAGTTLDTGSKPGENPAAEPVADPVPADLPALVARSADADLAPDLSCAGKPLPVGSGTPVAREYHLVALGGDDSDRIGGLPIELFYGNDPTKTADVTATSKDDKEDKTNTGRFEALTPSGFIAFHVPKATGSFETTALDFDTRVDGPLLATVATDDKVTALSLLIGGATWKAGPGLSRVVVRAVDCAGHPLAGAHVALQIDGVVSAIATTADDPGVRRSYFSDVELPSTAKWSSRSGVAAFLNVPNGKSIKLVVRGKVDAAGKVEVIAMRDVPFLADGVLTAKITPYSTVTAK